MQPTQSVDLFNTIPSNNSQSSSLFSLTSTSNYLNNQSQRLQLSPIDFLCTYYKEIIPPVTELLNQKFGQKLEKMTRSELFQQTTNDIQEILIEKKLLPTTPNITKYVDILLADIVGLGILEPLLSDSNVDEIMVNSHDKIFVEVGGKVKKTDFRFPSVENAKGIVTKIITPLNLRLDASSPNVNAQLPDGSRLSASVAPLRANNEISITIRKFSSTVEPLSYYAEKYQSQTKEMVFFLENAVKSKLSMLISGGTGSGKTTLLNSLSMAIPNDERILTVEDTLELKLQQDHVEPYQTVPANMEGKGAFTTQQVIIEALRKRPDRIIVGECRGPEIVEMLNAMNTGHEGSLSTLHANTPSDMIQRAMTMIRSNESTNSLNEITIYGMLNSALALIVQTNRLMDGSRRVVNITEVVGVGSDGVKKLQEKGVLTANSKPEKKLYIQDIFRFKQTGVDDNNKVHGYFEATGYVPFCLEKMQHAGCDIDESFFKKRILLEI